MDLWFNYGNIQMFFHLRYKVKNQALFGHPWANEVLVQAGVRCNVESANLEILNVEAPNVE